MAEKLQFVGLTRTVYIDFETLLLKTNDSLLPVEVFKKHHLHLKFSIVYGCNITLWVQ